MDEDLTGKVALCSKNILGVIEGRKELPWGLSWVGYKIDDLSLWASRNPKVIANSLDEFKAMVDNGLADCKEITCMRAQGGSSLACSCQR